MKHWKTILISVLFSMSTVGVLHGQEAPKLAVSVNSGLVRSGLPMQVGMRAGLGHHLALNGQFGTAPWKYKEKRDRRIATNVTRKDLRIRANTAYGFGLRAFTSPNQSGFYGGAGFEWQGVEITSKTELKRPRSGPSLASGASTLGGFLLGGFFDLLDNLTRNSTVERTDKALVRSFVVSAGYAHVFENTSRLEFGAKFQNRNIRGLQYNIPTFDGLKAFDLDEVADPTEVALEVRYVIPVF